MATDRLAQRYFFDTRSFEIKENGVRVMTKYFFNSESYFVPFENIGIEPYQVTSVSKGTWGALRIIGFFMTVLILVALSVGGFTPVFMFYLSIPVFFACAVFAFSRTSQVIYGFGDGAKIAFRRNNPNKQCFNVFVSQMQEAKKVYLRERYLALANANGFLDVQTLQWLRSLGALKQEEIEVMMEKRIF